MSYAYSPDTGELIRTETPAAWMENTNQPPPPYDPATQGCFFRNGAWVIVNPTPETPTVPVAVTMRQARLALLHAGVLATVNAAVAAMPGTDGDAARITWEFSQDVRRDDPLLATLASTLGLTDTAVDALFVAAAAL
jgi:hypothetical protein